MVVNTKQKNTLATVFERPVRSDISWLDIENLLSGLGATITEGRGSRVRVALNGVKAEFHRSHPERITDRGQAASLRRFLEEAGVLP